MSSEPYGDEGPPTIAPESDTAIGLVLSAGKAPDDTPRHEPKAGRSVDDPKAKKLASDPKRKAAAAPAITTGSDPPIMARIMAAQAAGVPDDKILVSRYELCFLLGGVHQQFLIDHIDELPARTEVGRRIFYILSEVYAYIERRKLARPRQPESAPRRPRGRPRKYPQSSPIAAE